MRELMIHNSVNPIKDTIANRPEVNKAADDSFGKIVSQAINDVNNKMVEAGKAVEGLTTGADRDIHGAMISMEKASISLQMLSQVRNKIIDAYKEVQRMSI